MSVFILLNENIYFTEVFDKQLTATEYIQKNYGKYQIHRYPQNRRHSLNQQNYPRPAINAWYIYTGEEFSDEWTLLELSPICQIF